MSERLVPRHAPVRVCLNIMVKNEAARIERCLASVAPHISTYAILDTGSTDGTDMMVRDILGARGLDGSVGHGEFTTFGDTRNRALELAHNLNLNGHAWDYLLLCDADMELVAPNGLGELTAPAYQVIQKSGGLEYWNSRLIRRDVPAKYIAPTHEYLSIDGDVQRLHGAYFIDHADGANRPGKVVRDIALLEAEIKTNPDDARSWFYLGNSLRELGHYKQAIEAYEKRVTLGGWNEEIYCSLLYASRSARALGR